MNLLIAKIVTVNGIDLAVHRLSRMELSPDLESAWINVESWATDDIRLSGAGPAWNWRVEAAVSGLVLTDGLHAGLVAAVLADDTFSGGSALADASDDLATAQARRWSEIRAIRDSLELGPVTYDSAQFDADAVAQRHIIGANGAATVARMQWLVACVEALATAASVTLPDAPATTIDWTRTDDTTVTLDEAGIFGLGGALMEHVAGAYATGRTLRDEIDAAASVEDVMAVVWPG